jgi:hypothetical protein
MPGEIGTRRCVLAKLFGEPGKATMAFEERGEVVVGHPTMSLLRLMLSAPATL